MATSILYPNGDGTVVGTLGGTPSPPPYYANIDEGTDSPNDADTITFSSNPGTLCVTLTDTPADCGTVTAVSIGVRTSNDSKGRTIASAQIFQSDETTALTSSETISGTTTPTTYVLNPTITGATTKTAWDGAVLKISAGGSSGLAGLYAAQVNITYTTGGGATAQFSFTPAIMMGF